jgi:hypothetical protein
MPTAQVCVGRRRRRPRLERLEGRLTPAGFVSIVNAPQTSPEGLQIDLVGQLNNLTGEPPPPDTVIFHWTIARSDGAFAAEAFLPAASRPPTPFQYVPPDDGLYIVTLWALDDFYPEPATARINVTNVAPQPFISGGPELPGYEGTTIDLDGFVFDPGTLDQHTLSWRVFRGGAEFASGTGADIVFTPDDEGDYVVELTATDVNDPKSVGKTTRGFTVLNADPVVFLTGAPDFPVPEGTAITLGMDLVDPGFADTHTLAWTVTRGGLVLATGAGDSFTFTPDDDGSYDVLLTATDNDGGVGTARVTIDAFNVPPVTDAGGAQTAFEGDLVTVNCSFTDAGTADTHTLAWQVTLDGVLLASGAGGSFSFVPDDNGLYLATFTATDDDGGVGSSTVPVTVLNLPPTADAGPDRTVALGSATTFVAAFTDPGAADTHVLTWQVLDGDAVIATGTGPTLVFTPAASGTFVVVLTVTDDDGGTAQDTAVLMVPKAVPVPVPTPDDPPADEPPADEPRRPGTPLLIPSGPAPVPEGPTPAGPDAGPFPPAPLANGALTSAGRATDESIAPRPDGGNGGAASPTDRGLGSPLVAAAPAASGQGGGGIPVVASEVGSTAFDAAGGRSQNLLPVNAYLDAHAAGKQRSLTSGSGGEDQSSYRLDHVRTKVVQTIASVTVEDDSVGIVEAIVNSAATPAATSPAVTGAVPTPPPRNDTAPVLLTPDARDEEEQSAPDEPPGEVSYWRRLIGAAAAVASLVAGVRLEFRRRSSTSRNSNAQETVPWQS